MQGIGEVDWLLIFVPSPVRIVQRFVDTGNSSMSHLTTKMQKEVREDFHWILLHPRVGRGSISVVRKLISTYHCFFLVLDRNQNQNFFFVLSKKWSLMKIFWFPQLDGISIFVLYNSTKYVNFSSSISYLYHGISN